jgi:prefoldin beta subunit
MVLMQRSIIKVSFLVLVKQEKQEAVSNVDKRIEFIKNEIKRMEKQIKDMESKQESKKMEIVKIQTALQSQSNPEAQAVS